MFAGPSRIQLIKNISSTKINKPKIQPKIKKESQPEKLKYKYFIDMHRTVWKMY